MQMTELRKPESLRELFATAKNAYQVHDLVQSSLYHTVALEDYKLVSVVDVEAYFAVVAEKERALRKLLETFPSDPDVFNLGEIEALRSYNYRAEKWFEKVERVFGELEASLSLSLPVDGKEPELRNKEKKP